MSIFFRDPRFASKTFRLKQPVLTGLPKPKFLYFVRFQRESALNPQTGVAQADSLNDRDAGISFLAKTVSRPSLKFETETLRQYNKKRVIQKGVDYSDVKITFYDTVDDRVLMFLINYMRWYYGDMRARDRMPWVNSSIENELTPITAENGSTFWAGFNPPDTTRIEQYSEMEGNSRYLSYVDIITFSANLYSGFRLINPVISSIDFDDLNNSESDPLTISITLNYEALIFPTELGPQGYLPQNMNIVNLIKNGEDMCSPDSAYNPPDMNINLLRGTFPPRNETIQVARIGESQPNPPDGYSNGFRRFSAGNFLSEYERQTNLVNQDIDNGSLRLTNVYGGIDFGTERPEYDRSLFATFNNYNLPSSGINPISADVIRGLLQTLGFKNNNVINSLTYTLQRISSQTSISPIELINIIGNNSNKNTRFAAIAGLLLNSIPKTQPQGVYGVPGIIGDVINYPIKSTIGAVQDVAYNLVGKPVNTLGQTINSFGQAVDTFGNTISTAFTNALSTVPQQNTSRQTTNSVDRSLIFASLLKR